MGITIPQQPTPSSTSDLMAAIAQRRHQLVDEIRQLKREKNAVILAHVYERLEVQDIADYQGDSLGLSQLAADTDAEVIVFCGVHFMAETAKLLSPQKTVYLANPSAGCPMADMITREQLLEFKAQYPGKPVVSYVNTSAEVKAESDYCCTSSNALKLVESVVEQTGQRDILFVPDKHLAGYVQEQLPDVNIIPWDGFCPTHMRIDPEDVCRLKKQHPEAVILAHPECEAEVKAMADYIGSTTAIVQAAHMAECTKIIVCTEDGVAQKLAQECPEKAFFTPNQATAICPNMKMTRLENIKRALQGEVAEVIIPEDIAQRARTSIERMMAVPASNQPVPKLCGCQNQSN